MQLRVPLTFELVAVGYVTGVQHVKLTGNSTGPI